MGDRMVHVEQSGAGAPLSEALTGITTGLAQRSGIAHALVAVERGDGSLRWVGAAGDATPEGQPMQPETPFFIASITKLFIATAVLRQCEKGSVELDVPMATYLPRELTAGLHRMGGTDYTERITVWNLLAHTSGLPDYIEDAPRGGQSLVERLFQLEDRELALDEMVEQVRTQLQPHFAPQPRDAAKPKVRYSDTNYQLLIGIVESVTGTPMTQVYQDELFRPLELRHTFLPGDEPLDPTPEPATLWYGSEPMEMPRLLRSFGDLYSTADDLLRFLRALIGGRVFEDPATVGLMQQRWLRFGFPTDRAAMRSPSWPIEYGLGMMRFRLPRLFTLLRPLPAVLGHTGSTGTWLFYCPDMDLYLTGAVDQVTAGAVPYRLLPRLLRAIEDANG